ncbi:GNAT family N-acetyltransferase [Desulfoluna spongiiphila]|uniref:Acetyltransferase (GNAT) family protein n=1 Tax=Desulfoluna spongiiphila TaxID=419481 RepID=A0A1G5BNR5_9BACT|nr:GNAT family N-acetyltransferase [Desulfoluna spongiiphila]SCX91726.1 Acetyltransferase (GNAT) family protein [Desulfoluna spongiiphila]VVS93832.1 acyl-coa n-acyltransferase [Desulfoluna spongiiphila]
MKKKSQNPSILLGQLPEELEESAIEVFLNGFERKIDHLMLKPRDRSQARRVYRDGADFSSGIYALCEGRVTGMLGLQYQNRKFIHLNLATLNREFGFFGGVTRKLSGSVFKDIHPLDNDEIRVQVISVADGFRGTGVGHRLLETLFTFGRTQNLSCVRLEVVNTNPGAKRLYEKLGFTECGLLPYGPIAAKAGFSSQFRMKKPL